MLLRQVRRSIIRGNHRIKSSARRFQCKLVKQREQFLMNVAIALETICDESSVNAFPVQSVAVPPDFVF